MIFGAMSPDAVSEKVSADTRVPLARLALWFFVSRAALWSIAGLARQFVPRGPYHIGDGIPQWLDRWDAGWYISIAAHGYHYDPNAKSNAAFFPLYPMLARGLSTIVPNLLVSGYIISALFLFGCCLVLWKLVVRDYGSRALADRAVLFLLLCPVTIFYSSFYTESLFLFLALCVAYLAGASRWLSAGVCGFFAALTRPPGALLAVLVATEYWMKIRERQRDPDRPRVFFPAEALSVVVALLLPLCAIFGFAYYLFLRFHDAKIMFRVHDQWGQHLEGPWWIFISGFMYVDKIFYMFWFDAAVIVAGVLAYYGVKFRLRPSHLAMLFAYLLLYSTNSLLEAIPRYLSVLFPFYIIAAELCLRNPRWERWFLGTSAALATLSIVLFVDGYWFT